MNGLARWVAWEWGGFLGLRNRNYSIYPTTQLQDIQLAVQILPKRADAPTRRQQPRPVGGNRVARILNGVNRAVAVVGVEIEPPEDRQGGAAIHVAARDRARAEAVRILDHRQDARSRAGIHRVAVQPFHNIPAKVGAAAPLHRGRRDIDLFEAVLPHVSDIEVAGLAIE